MNDNKYMTHVSDNLPLIQDRIFANGKMHLFAPAKINLVLAITGKREDGYHELVSLMTPLRLTDELIIHKTSGNSRISCNVPGIPEDETNLAMAALIRFLEKTGTKDRFFIQLDKNIPVAAGLGGGSSDGAAVLRGLNRFYGYPLSDEELVRLAVSLGADLPFFLNYQPAVARGIGEIISYCAFFPLVWLVLVNPGFAVSTGKVYGKVNLGLTKCKKKSKNLLFKVQGNKKNSDSLELDEICEGLCNDLEPVTSNMHPVIHEIKAALMATGARAALMSGSGPSVFGIYRDKKEAQSACLQIQSQTRWKTLVSHTLAVGHEAVL